MMAAAAAATEAWSVDVDGNEMAGEAFARQQGGGFFAGQLVARAQQDGGTGAADLPGDFKADALVRAGDQCSLFR